MLIQNLSRFNLKNASSFGYIFSRIVGNISACVCPFKLKWAPHTCSDYLYLELEEPNCYIEKEGSKREHGPKVYNKYQGPKIVALFHLLLVLKSLQGGP